MLMTRPNGTGAVSCLQRVQAVDGACGEIQLHTTPVVCGTSVIGSHVDSDQDQLLLYNACV